MKNGTKIILSIIITIIFGGCEKFDFNKQRVFDNRSSSQGGLTYYVSPTGNDNNSGSSTSAPLLTLARAAALAKPGDIVYFMAGTYNFTRRLDLLTSGLPDKYITFAAMPGTKPKFFVAGDLFSFLTINASYIIIDGIEFVGNNANLTYDAALAAYNAAAGGAAATGIFNTTAILVGGPAAESKLPHHVKILNCEIHDFPGGGIQVIQADYINIEGNIVYNNAWYGMYAQSGISTLNPVNFDNSTEYKYIVRNNITYGNKATIPWLSQRRLSDGNGIIIDVNNRVYGATTGTGYYTGRTLVENNLSYNNGGSGIHAFDAQHVDIINNTVYQNGQVVGYADLYAAYATDVRMMNNIIYSRNGGRVNSVNTSGGANVIYSNNIFFNGTVAVAGTNNIVADPRFIAPSINPFGANFQLQASSPAVNGANATLFALKDLLGVARPKGAAADIGAYESF